MKILCYILSIALLASCGGKKEEKETNANQVVEVITFDERMAVLPPEESTLLDEFGMEDEVRIPTGEDVNVNLFDFSHYTFRDDYLFSSLSDIHMTKEGTKIMPSLEGKTTPEEVEHFLLEGEYRINFLEACGFEETDSVFIYFYKSNKLLSYPIDDVPVAAYIGPYDSYSTKEQIAELAYPNYQFGFEFLKSSIDKMDRWGCTYLAVGKTNPFAMQQMQAPRWKKVNNEQFPQKKIPKLFGDYFADDFAKWTKEDTYLYEYEGLQYFVQTYRQDYALHHRLIVVDKETDEYLLDDFITRDEGGSPAPLNGIQHEGYNVQWVGKLLKGQPTMAMGFEYASAGCE